MQDQFDKNEARIRELKAAGLDYRSACRMLRHAKRIGERNGGWEIIDVIFAELSDGTWSPIDVWLDTKTKTERFGQVGPVVSSWEGQEMPSVTGRRVRYSNITATGAR